MCLRLQSVDKKRWKAKGTDVPRLQSAAVPAGLHTLVQQVKL